MAKLSEEITAYLEDPRFERVIGLVGQDAPTPIDIGSDTDAQVVNNQGFTQKGWLQYQRALRGLKKKHNSTKHTSEIEATYTD